MTQIIHLGDDSVVIDTQDLSESEAEEEYGTVVRMVRITVDSDELTLQLLPTDRPLSEQ